MITLTSLTLIVCIISLGLFAGLMLTLVVIMQRMWLAMLATTYVDAMQTFLPAAKGNPVIALLTILPIVAPIPALIELNANSESNRFVITMFGTFFSCGPLAVTLRFNFPIYATMMSWQKQQLPEDWQRVRQRFYWLNLIRLILAGAAMLCFLLALALGN